MRYNLKPILSVNDNCVTLKQLQEFINDNYGVAMVMDEVSNPIIPYELNDDLYSPSGQLMSLGDHFYFRNDIYIYVDKYGESGDYQYMFINLGFNQLCISNTTSIPRPNEDMRVKSKIGDEPYISISLGNRKKPVIDPQVNILDNNGNPIDPYIYITGNPLDTVTTVPGTLLQFTNDQGMRFIPVISWGNSKLLDIIQGNSKLVSPKMVDLYLDLHKVSSRNYYYGDITYHPEDDLFHRVNDSFIQYKYQHDPAIPIEVKRSEGDFYDKVSWDPSSIYNEESNEISVPLPLTDGVQVNYDELLDSEFLEISDLQDIHDVNLQDSLQDYIELSKYQLESRDILHITLEFSKDSTFNQLVVNGNDVMMDGYLIQFHSASHRKLETVEFDIMVSKVHPVQSIGDFQVQLNPNYLIVYPINKSITEYHIHSYKIYKY